MTKQAILEMALNEQVKERQEMEKKLQKIAKTMDYLERAKREEEAPLIEEAYRQRLKDEEIFFERQQKVGLEFFDLDLVQLFAHLASSFADLLP